MTALPPRSPVAPSRRASDIRPYIAISERRAPAVSGDGSRLVWLSNETGHAQIWRAEAQAAVGAVQLTRMEEPVGKMAFLPGSRDLILTTDRGGDERHQIWRLRDGAHTPEKLTDDPRVVHLFGAAAPDGGRIAYMANDRDPAAMDAFVMDLQTGTATRVWQGHGFGEVLAFFRDGAALLIRTAEASSRHRLWRLDLAGGALSEVWADTDTGPGPGAGPTEVRAARLMKDGDTLLALADRGRDRVGLFRVSLATGTATLLAGFDDRDIDGFALSPDEGQVVLVVNRDGYQSHALLTLGDGALEALPPPVAGLCGVPVFHPATGRLVFGAEGATTPPSIWTQATDGSPAQPLARGELPDLPAMRAPRLDSFTSFDGLEIPAFVYDPEGPAPAGGWPVLVIVHGGPELQWQPTFRYDVQWMLANGIRVVAPNVRGSTGYGRAFHAADDLDRRMDSVKDLLALRDWLAADPAVDAARIGVFGRSYGGFMVLAAMVEAPEAWCLGVNFYGIANFETMIQTTGPWRRALRAAEYGDPDTTAEDLAEFSPIHRIERIAAPLMLVHAFEDPRVPIGETEMVHSCLTGLQRPVEYLRIAHEGHGFARTANRQTVHVALADFLIRHL